MGMGVKEIEKYSLQKGLAGLQEMRRQERRNFEEKYREGSRG